MSLLITPVPRATDRSGISPRPVRRNWRLVWLHHCNSSQGRCTSDERHRSRVPKAALTRSHSFDLGCRQIDGATTKPISSPEGVCLEGVCLFATGFLFTEYQKLEVEGLRGPTVLFGIQFTLSLVAYALIALWYVVPRLSALPREEAVMPLLWVHAFRIVGGTILAPGAVDVGVPTDFRQMVGYGDLATAVLALVALIALRSRFPGAVALAWLCVLVGTADTANAIVQSARDTVFTHPIRVYCVTVSL